MVEPPGGRSLRDRWQRLLGGPQSWRRMIALGVVAGIILATIGALVAAGFAGGSGSLDDDPEPTFAPAIPTSDEPAFEEPTEIPIEQPTDVPIEEPTDAPIATEPPPTEVPVEATPTEPPPEEPTAVPTVGEA